MLATIESRIAQDISATVPQVAAAVALLDEGATVPFISRYRKEATGGLDDTQLRTLQERLMYLRELEDRRAAILSSIREQGKLTSALEAAITHAPTKQRLEDLYLPYKVKRRTKAQIAREAGLDVLASRLLTDPTLVPETAAESFMKPAFKTEQGDNPGVADVKAALDGARQILMEQFAEDAQLLATLRGHLQEHGVMVSTVVAGKEAAAEKFRDYFAYQESFKSVPPHRALALFRGRKEAKLSVSLKLPEELLAAASGTTASGASAFECLRSENRGAVRGHGWPPTGGCLVAANRALDLVGQVVVAAGNGTLDGVTHAGGRGGDTRVRTQPPRSVAGGAGRPTRDDGTRSGPAHGREGRDRRQHGQIARHRDSLSARTAQRLERCARGLVEARETSSGWI